MKARSVIAEQVCEGERMGVQLNKATPGGASTPNSGGLAELDWSSTDA